MKQIARRAKKENKMKIQGEVLWLTPEERDELDIIGRNIVIRKRRWYFRNTFKKRCFKVFSRNCKI